MKSGTFGARYGVLVVALTAASAVLAQSDTSATLKEVVVKASRFAESADTLPYGVSVITARDIANSGALSVNEAIMRVLGVPGRLDTTGGNNYALDLRGFGEASGSNQVIVVDGIRIDEQDLSASPLSAVPIEQVERIEVIRGSGSVVYGEGATGGVILVTTKAGQGIERHNSAQVSATAGSFGLHEERSSATVVAGGFSVDVAASERGSDGHRDNFASNINNASATAQWTNDWLRAGVQTARTLTHSGLPGPLTADQYIANPHQSSTPQDYGDVKNETSRVFLETTKGDWQFGADVATRMKTNAVQYVAIQYIDSYSVKADTAGLRARNQWRNADFVNAVAIGVDSNQWRRTYAPNSVSRSESNAVYATDDITYLPSGTRLAVGYRADQIHKSDAFGDVVDDTPNAWSVGLTQDLGGGKNIYARIGQSYRVANVDEISFTNQVGNLLTQTSRDTEVGARWQYPQGHVELRWYRSDLRNEIGYDSNSANPGGPPGSNVNFDPTQRQGFEFESRNTLGQNIALRVNAAVRQSRFTQGPYAGKDVPLAPDQTLAVGGEWTPGQGHLVYVGLNWVSSQSPGSDFTNQCVMPAYTSVDTRYAYTLKNTELSLGVTNLLDDKYYTEAYGCGSGVVQAIYPEAGRAIAATLKFKF
jgi:iron complex outermembrane receptor protein